MNKYATFQCMLYYKNTIKEKSRLQNGLIQKRPLSVSMFNTSLPSTVFFTTNKGIT